MGWLPFRANFGGFSRSNGHCIAVHRITRTTVNHYKDTANRLTSDYVVRWKCSILPCPALRLLLLPKMSHSTRDSIYEALASIRLVDPHTHINPHNPASQTLADILGYHYYTELVHSAGMPKSHIEEDGISPRELVGRLVEGLPNIENTANYQWLINICKTFFDFADDRITMDNWEALFDSAEERMASAQWPQMVLDKSNVEAVFLTNDFDDDLEGFDTHTYIPCLRTDDLVFHLGKSETRQRLAACSGIELDGSLESLRSALRQRFEHFVSNGVRACAISIPPDFQPDRVADGRARTAIDAILTGGVDADVSHHVALSRRVFWTLAELCDEFELPFDLMIGVNRGVYPGGVYQGQDLYDSRVSLTQYRKLFNAFPEVKFPISVLASVTNQELVSHAWIFPNVITNGHWWYSNTPSFIARDAAARLEAVPRNKQIGYYSDAYKLEFVWPKFDMYRNILADILADYFVGDCGWDEEQAIALGHQVLRGNVDTIFPDRFAQSDDPLDQESSHAAPSATTEDAPAVTAAASAALAAEAIGMVEVSEVAEVAGVHEIVSLPADQEYVDQEYADQEYVDQEYVDQEDVDQEDADQEPADQEPADQEPVVELESYADETLDDSIDEMDLDPNPSEDEIQAAGVDDVVIDDPSESTIDAESIASQIDDEPLDVGDLLSDDDDEPELVDHEEPVDDPPELSPEIHLLRGEESFSPDEDSLQLVKDPATGELMFGQPDDTPAPSVETSRESDFVDDDDFGAGIEATIELDQPYEEAQADRESDLNLGDDSGEIDLLEFDEEES